MGSKLVVSVSIAPIPFSINLSIKSIKIASSITFKYISFLSAKYLFVMALIEVIRLDRLPAFNFTFPADNIGNFDLALLTTCASVIFDERGLKSNRAIRSFLYDYVEL